MNRLFFCFLLIGFNTAIFAQELIDESVRALHDNIKKDLALGLKYLELTQRQETVAGRTFKGEWQTYMYLQRGFLLLGGKNEIDDSNCFSIASIHNSLAKIYLSYPEYDNIPRMLDLSFERVMGYKQDDKFNFWNLLPPNRDLKKGDVVGKQPLVRRPTNYKLRTRYINNAANIVEDADDTSLGYMAIALRNKILQRERPYDSLKRPEAPIAPIFDKYRDVSRNNLHWYNYLNGNDRKTSAYLTWLGTENTLKHWNIAKVFVHNTFFFIPSSQCFPHPYKPYIPYGTNDLDGVVNANVLSALALNGELNAEGAAPAIRFIEKKSKREKYDRVGIYYPNRYQFPYAVSNAYANGVKDLDTSTQYILKFLLQTQEEDGGWSSRNVINNKDRLQSTAYALNALINIGDFEQNKTKAPIEKAIRFIQKQAIYDEQGVHWKGGVFFSGGTVVRTCLFWRSDAYTTVIILNALANYRRHIELKYAMAETTSR